MKKNDLAWTAGFFEGEGTVRINKATKQNLGNLAVSVVNTDKSTIEWFYNNWQGYFRELKMNGNCKMAYRWVISSKMAMAFLKQIKPFIKRENVYKKINLAIEFQKQKKHGRFFPDEYHEQQFSYYLQMRELNQRGIN